MCGLFGFMDIISIKKEELDVSSNVLEVVSRWNTQNNMLRFQSLELIDYCRRLKLV